MHDVRFNVISKFNLYVMSEKRFFKDMELNDETLLEEGPAADFRGAQLQIHQDSYLISRSPSSQGDDSESVAKLPISPEVSSTLTMEKKEDSTLKPAVSSGVDIVSPIASMPKRISERIKQGRSKSDTPLPSNIVCQNPLLDEDEAKDFFTYRNGIVSAAVQECISHLLVPAKDGEIVGSWLLTEISLWDAEKERLVLLTSNSLITIKYDFIALKCLEHRKVPLEQIDTLVIGDIVYPSGSLVPRLNGLATGVSNVVKGCLLRPLQERWAQDNNRSKDFCASAFDLMNFEPRPRQMRGVRAMWNHGQPLTFTRKWNPFTNDIPWTTFASHPLLWRKEGDCGSNQTYDVDEFARNIVNAVEKAQGTNPSPCRIEHKPIVMENYVGLGSLIHNRNALGFFKVRGKFSF